MPVPSRLTGGRGTPPLRPSVGFRTLCSSRRRPSGGLGDQNSVARITSRAGCRFQAESFDQSLHVQIVDNTDFRTTNAVAGTPIAQPCSAGSSPACTRVSKARLMLLRLDFILRSQERRQWFRRRSIRADLSHSLIIEPITQAPCRTLVGRPCKISARVRSREAARLAPVGCANRQPVSPLSTPGFLAWAFILLRRTIPFSRRCARLVIRVLVLFAPHEQRRPSMPRSAPWLTNGRQRSPRSSCTRARAVPPSASSVAGISPWAAP